MIDVIKDREKILEVMKTMKSRSKDFKSELKQTSIKMPNNEIDSNQIELYNPVFNELIFKLIEKC